VAAGPATTLRAALRAVLGRARPDGPERACRAVPCRAVP
jgi:hypothetical protein